MRMNKRLNLDNIISHNLSRKRKKQKKKICINRRIKL